MKVIQVNNVDLIGARFNGYDLQLHLNKIGIQARQLVYEKLSCDPNVISFGEPLGINNYMAYAEFEKHLAIQGLIYPYGRKIMNMKAFQAADVIHYHLIHNHFISLFDFAKMTVLKPSIWTIHDPWAFTGHCIHPMECTKWRQGCKNCENLARSFALEQDHADQMWKIKKTQYTKMNLDIVVASQWMLNFVQESPLTRHFSRVYLIPFGVNLALFNDSGTKNSDRQELKINPRHFVIAFRSDPGLFKGLKYIKAMLEKLPLFHPVTLLTVGQKGLLEEFKGKYEIREYGWVNSEQKMAQIYSAADLFLMPSVAESFGLMAVEAMASSRPVIVFEGTALPAVTNAPECGIALAPEDTAAFVQVVERLMRDPAECIRRGQLGRQLAEKNYDEQVYFSRLLELYQQVASRKNSVGER